MQDSRNIQGNTDMCTFGLAHEELDGTRTLVKKPTGFVMESSGFADKSVKLCEGGHTYRHLVAGRATEAENYPDKLCGAICRGPMQELVTDEAQLATTCKVYRKELSGRNLSPYTCLSRRNSAELAG